MKQIQYLSSGDNTLQPALFQPALSSELRPLVVALHTWSGDLTQSCVKYSSRCCARDWHFVFPLFRGPNWNKEACGSDLVVADIVSVANYIASVANVDRQRIYLVGGSGGGHATLLVAGRAPEIWAAASAWCPISDLVSWHRQCRFNGEGYDKHIESACGGNPAISEEYRNEALRRSPVTYLSGAKKLILDISTGIHDGYTGSVPVSQAINGFNAVADPEDRISREDIDYMVRTQRVPRHLQTAEVDPAFGWRKVWLRRISGNVRLTLFEGGHDLLEGPALEFLSRQRLGTEPDWSCGEHSELGLDTHELGR